MGNSSSRDGSASKSANTGPRGSSRDGTTSKSANTRPRGGHLDPKNQLEEVYKRMIDQNEHVKQQIQKTFQSVRILVVGRAGSGKTTLIRLLVGKDGPKGISLGDVGEQDILKEWRHPDPALRLIIHDSNGIDTAGHSRLADIKSFLDQRLSSEAKFEERVHAIWYVFNAVDNRVLNDGGLLEMLDDYGNDLPLLLIMTHKDVSERLGEGMDEDVLCQLLGKINEETKRKKLKETMVKVGNQIKYDRVSDEMKEGSIKDINGMNLVFEGTKQLMNKELWITWASCQALNTNSKLEASAKLIVRIRKQQIYASSAVATLPVAQQMQLAAMFGSVTRSLAKIWNASSDLEKAITYKFLAEERWHAVTKNLARNTIGALALAGTLTLTVLTGGIGAPSVLVAAAGSAWSQAGKTSTVLMSYALMVLGAIIYVKTHDLQTEGGKKATVDGYLKLCEEFVASKWATKVSKFSKGYTSMWETSFREKLQRERLRSEIVNFFNDMNMCRPRSLRSQMNQGANIIRIDADVDVAVESEQEESEEEGELEEDSSNLNEL